MTTYTQLKNSTVASNIFPNFKEFNSEDFGSYQKHMYDLPQHCDFTLNNLMVWLAGTTSIQYSWLNNNIVLKVSDTVFDENLSGTWYTVLGRTAVDETLSQLFEQLKIDRLLMVPDYFIENVNLPQKYIITEDRNNRDYIINIEELLQKNGKFYENFRHQISYFMKNFSSGATLRDIDLSNVNEVSGLINATHTWTINSFAQDGNDRNKLDAKAIDRLFNLQPILPIKHKCIGLFINDSLEGFSIFHVPFSRDKIAMGNHIKTNDTHKRIFDFLIYATASRLNSEGITLLNAEQDMGIEGIRKHKSYLNPFTYYKKYSITQR